jgi:hypothetical protein
VQCAYKRIGSGTNQSGEDIVREEDLSVEIELNDSLGAGHGGEPADQVNGIRDLLCFFVCIFEIRFHDDLVLSVL